jgi:hypothetical protein
MYRSVCSKCSNHSQSVVSESETKNLSPKRLLNVAIELSEENDTPRLNTRPETTRPTRHGRQVSLTDNDVLNLTQSEQMSSIEKIKKPNLFEPKILMNLYDKSEEISVIEIDLDIVQSDRGKARSFALSSTPPKLLTPKEVKRPVIPILPMMYTT